jgi:serine/threonine-protein kinase HipA
MTRARVFVNDTEAGILTEEDSGLYTFNYLKDYEGPIVSLTFVNKDITYTSPFLFPFFDGLIPEGWLLNLFVKNWKLNINDRMNLLINCCKDCIGNVRIEKYE